MRKSLNMAENNKISNALTVDVEDYFQVENFTRVISFSDWDKYESRVVKNTEKVLKILDDSGTKATFFVLGWVAEHFPELVKKIHQAGHEIASHGYAHKLIFTQTPEKFRTDLRRAKNILEDIIQKSILGYRAPTYSITHRSLWALDILAEEGFKYDSSIFPIHHDKGGIPDAKQYPYHVQNSNGGIWEFPLSTVRILGQNVPFSGGGYFRFFPYRFVKWAIKSINKTGYPAILFIHPWELDPEQPRINVNMVSRFRHYVNLSKTEGKLIRLLNDFKFAPVKEVLGLK